jgi:hypothetical protein
MVLDDLVDPLLLVEIEPILRIRCLQCRSAWCNSSFRDQSLPWSDIFAFFLGKASTPIAARIPSRRV